MDWHSWAGSHGDWYQTPVQEKGSENTVRVSRLEPPLFSEIET